MEIRELKRQFQHFYDFSFEEQIQLVQKALAQNMSFLEEFHPASDVFQTNYFFLVDGVTICDVCYAPAYGGAMKRPYSLLRIKDQFCCSERLTDVQQSTKEYVPYGYIQIIGEELLVSHDLCFQGDVVTDTMNLDGTEVTVQTSLGTSVLKQEQKLFPPLISYPPFSFQFQGTYFELLGQIRELKVAWMLYQLNQEEQQKKHLLVLKK